MHGDGWTRRRLETQPDLKTKVVTIFASNRAFILTYLHFTCLHFITEHIMYLTILTILLGVCSHVTSGIFCYVCESVRDFRCLDPFDFQPFPQVHRFISRSHKRNVFCSNKLSVFLFWLKALRSLLSQLSLKTLKLRLMIKLQPLSLFRLTAAHSPS